MKSKTETILIVLNTLVWIVFVGLMVETGAILISFIISLVKPEDAKNLYKDVDLLELRRSGIVAYFFLVSVLIGLTAVKSFSAYLVLKILTQIKLENPFKIEIAQLMEKISYYILAVWVVSILLKMTIEILVQKHFLLRISSESGEYLFLAGIIFIFAQVFKKGIEIQSENELTV